MKNVWKTFLTNKKWLIVGCILLILGIIGLYVQTSQKKTAASPQQVVKVQRGDVAAAVSATGNLQPINTVDISSKITAQIREVKVKENDRVKAGQVLVVLEDDDIQPQLIQARERLNNAEVNYKRDERLSAIGVVPQQQLDNSEMEYNIAQTNYDQILSKLNETVITSPIDGTVIGKPLPAGQMVAQGVSNPTVILTVADMSKMQIEAQVDQTDIGKVTEGQKVVFSVDAYPDQKFTGTVSKVSQKAVTQQNVIYYTVTIDVDGGENLLKPSMVARVSIIEGESKGVLLLPLAAIRTDKDEKYVVVQNESGKLTNVPIITGLTGDDKVEIKSGLNEGDTVVVAQGQSSSGQQGQKTNGSGGNPMNTMMRRM